MANGQNPAGRARALYEQRVTPQRARQMRRLLAESSALMATTVLCEYLNRWNNLDRAEMERAAAVVEEAHRSHPTLYLADYAMGFVHRARGEHAASRDAFDRTIRRRHGFARAYAQKGEALV